MTAMATRTINEKQDFRFNLLSLQKWDFIRMKRAEFERNIEERLRQRRQMRKLVIHARKQEIIEFIARKYKELKAKKAQEARELLCCIRLKTNYKSHIRRFGATMQDRLRNHIRHSIDVKTATARKTLLDRA